MQKTTPKIRSEVEVAWRARESRARQKRRNAPGEWFERERVAAVVEAYIARHDRQYDSTTGGNYATVASLSGRDHLAAESGFSVRTLYRILGGRPGWRRRITPNGLTNISIMGHERFLSIDTVDRLFCAMNCVHLFHVAGADGGFADVYLYPSSIEPEIEPEFDVIIGTTNRRGHAVEVAERIAA